MRLNPFASAKPRTGSRRISFGGIAAALAINKPDVGHVMTRSVAYSTWTQTAHSVADVLQSGNPKFNRKRFLEAAGAL